MISQKKKIETWVKILLIGASMSDLCQSQCAATIYIHVYIYLRPSILVYKWPWTTCMCKMYVCRTLAKFIFAISLVWSSARLLLQSNRRQFTHARPTMYNILLVLLLQFVSIFPIIVKGSYLFLHTFLKKSWLLILKWLPGYISTA